MHAYQHSEYCIIQNNNEDETTHEPSTSNDDELVHSDNIDEDEVGSSNVLYSLLIHNFIYSLLLQYHLS